jgi:hypothetical protein
MKTIKSSLKHISKYGNDNQDCDIYNLNFIHFLRSKIDKNNKDSLHKLCKMLSSKKIIYHYLLYKNDFINFFVSLKEINHQFKIHLKILYMKLLLINRENEKMKYHNLMNMVFYLCDKKYNRENISKLFKKFCFHIKIENRPNVLYHYIPYYILNKLYGIDNDLSENNLREMCSDINLFFENENIEELNIRYQKMNNINK